MIELAALLARITGHYLESTDFNGIPLGQLQHEFSLTKRQIRPAIKALIKAGQATVVFGDYHPNPHIKAYPSEAADEQIVKLRTADLTHVCAYPAPAHLEAIVDSRAYQDRPFTLRLALGEPQLNFSVFDLSILETYRNDPRYYYRTNDVSGSISATSSDSVTPLRESDEVVLQSFGFAYDPQLNRAVAVFLRYLAGLSPSHQQIWHAKLLEGDYKLHSDYYRSSIRGEWHERVSIFSAFIAELGHINKLSELMKRPGLFRNEYNASYVPSGFAFLIRPTLAEYSSFIHLLDKMMSENINRSFFMSEIPLEREIERGVGKIQVQQKGTIILLQEWLTANLRNLDDELLDLIIQPFKDVRRERQHPAHAVAEDKFDEKYFELQRQVTVRAYNAVRALRMLFQDHPAALGYAVPGWLEDGRIWTR
jgi:hypothetical protein